MTCLTRGRHEETSRIGRPPGERKHHRNYDEWTKQVAPLYLVPHINQEDLGSYDPLNAVYHKPPSMAPIHFLLQDFRATYLGRALRILTGPFSPHTALWHVDEELPRHFQTVPAIYHHEYGLHDWELFRLCETEKHSLLVGDMWLGLNAQVLTYHFSRRLCLFLLKVTGIKSRPSRSLTLLSFRALPRPAATTRTLQMRIVIWQKRWTIRVPLTSSFRTHSRATNNASRRRTLFTRFTVTLRKRLGGLLTSSTTSSPLLNTSTGTSKRRMTSIMPTFSSASLRVRI